MRLTRRSDKRQRNSGYSVLEILIVLSIITLLVAVVGPRLIGYLERAKSQTATIQIDGLKGAVRLFYIDMARYPSAEEGLQVLVERPAEEARWAGPYLESASGLIDPWERPYLYRPPSGDAPLSIWSLGRDGAEGGDGEDADLGLPSP